MPVAKSAQSMQYIQPSLPKRTLESNLNIKKDITRASFEVYLHLLNHYPSMAMYLPYKVEFRQDSSTIGDPMRNNNKLARVYYHSPWVLANHSIFSLLYKIILAYGVTNYVGRISNE